jgi:hypothetical protein
MQNFIRAVIKEAEDALYKVTGSLFNEGEPDERIGLHNVILNSDGDPITPATEDSLDKLTTSTSFVTGRKTVTTHNTPVQITATPTSVKYVTIQALPGNVGSISVGHSDAVRASPEASMNGIMLEAGDAYPVDIDDLSKVWIDASVDGEGVTYMYHV